MRYTSLLALIPAAIVYAQAPAPLPRPSLDITVYPWGIKYAVTNVRSVCLVNSNGNMVLSDIPTDGILRLHSGKYCLKAEGYRGQQVNYPFSIRFKGYYKGSDR